MRHKISRTATANPLKLTSIHLTETAQKLFPQTWQKFNAVIDGLITQYETDLYYPDHKTYFGMKEDGGPFIYLSHGLFGDPYKRS